MPILTPAGHGMGYLRDLPDHRDKPYVALKERISGAVATQGGLTDDQLPRIWNQLSIGSCTAHGSLRAFVALLMQLGITLPTLEPPVPGQGNSAPFSRLEQYANTRILEGTLSTDSGAQVRDAIKALKKYGVAAETLWPYNVANFAVRPTNSVSASGLANEALSYHRITVGGPGAPMRTALANKRVIVIGFNVPESFEDGTWDPSSGEPLPLPGPSENFIGGHCVGLRWFNFASTLVSGPYYTGRRGNFFTADNSWDESWGMNGRFNIDAEYFNPSRGLASDFWVLDSAK